jgi:hypothetical protein
METNTLPKNEGQEAFEIVLKEFVEEQGKINKANADIITAINKLTVKVNDFTEILKNQKVIVPAPDTRPMQQIVEKGMAEIGALTETTLQRFRSNNMRVFLESDAKKWAVILILGIVFMTYVYFYVKR